VRFEVGDVYRLPFPDASFDAVFATLLTTARTLGHNAYRRLCSIAGPFPLLAAGLGPMKRPIGPDTSVAPQLVSLRTVLIPMRWPVPGRPRPQVASASSP
jgi:Methyltransferase domain